MAKLRNKILKEGFCSDFSLKIWPPAGVFIGKMMSKP